MASSPAPSIDSLPGANSIGSFGEPTDYLSDSPLTLSATASSNGTGSSPPVSDSAIGDDYLLTGGSSVESTGNSHSNLKAHNVKNVTNHQQQQQQLLQQNSCLGTDIVIANNCAQITSNGIGSLLTSDQINSADLLARCTGCKGKQSIAVAKCTDCVNLLCANCEAAHEFMHCFDGHNVYRIPGSNAPASTTNSIKAAIGSHLNTTEYGTKLIMNSFDAQRLSLSLNLKSTDDSSPLMKSIMNNVITPPNPINPLGQTQDSLFSSLSSNIAGLNNGCAGKTTSASSYFCQRHKSELLKFFCRTCNTAICKDCMMLEHPSTAHDCDHNADPTPKQIESLMQTIQDIRSKTVDMRQIIKNAEHGSVKLQTQFQAAQNEINETFQFYRSMLDERKNELLKELEGVYNAKNMSQTMLITRSQEHLEKMTQKCEFVDTLLNRYSTIPDTNLMRKILENNKQQFLTLLQDLQSPPELDFCSNYQAIQVGVRNTFGYIRSGGEMTTTSKQPPIARPTNGHNNGNGNYMMSTNGSSPTSSTGSLNMLPGHYGGSSQSHLDRPFSNGGLTSVASTLSTSPIQHNMFDSSSTLLSKRFSNASVVAATVAVANSNNLGPFTDITSMHPAFNTYEKWSNGDIFNNITDQYGLTTTGSSGGGSIGQPEMIDLSSKLMQSSMFPLKSHIKRHKMIYHCKFGEFGVLEGQFTEPSGVAVNAQNDIIVADTNNHRIQIFDKEGRFKFQFGECGKRDGQLLYPNRVAVVKTSGDIIVTERSPTHQIQIYNQYGQFVRKFGANILQHPRGVTVDNKGRIIVVECKVMRVIIFDQNGNVLQKFGCSKHLEFPNGVVVNEKQEIFISDNRAHCVKVFNYEGVYLRQIGGEGITNYPIGVGINAAGEILIADNHNNFNLTIFSQDNQMNSALESKVKHAQCFDVALMDDGSVVLASKDYRLYIYRYVQVPPIGVI